MAEALLIRVVSFVLVIFMLIVTSECLDDELELCDVKGRQFIMKLDKVTELRHQTVQRAAWDYAINRDSKTEENYRQEAVLAAKLDKDAWNRTKRYNSEAFQSPSLRRKFRAYKKIGFAALPETDYEQRLRIAANLINNFEDTRICPYNKSENCDLQYKDVLEILRSSRNVTERKYIVMEWFRFAGASAKYNFSTLVNLTNAAAVLNGYDSAMNMWLANYEILDFDTILTSVWEELEPLYTEMHAYLRNSLLNIFENELTKSGPIPFHLLGLDPVLTRPFPDGVVNVTRALEAERLTPVKILDSAEVLLTSLGLPAVSANVWTHSVFEEPSDKAVHCKNLVYDMLNGEDFRMKMCAPVNDEGWNTGHSMMTQIHYFMEYKSLPYIFRKPALPAFQQAIGDAIALSASTPKHLKRIGLVEDEETENMMVNRLYDLAYKILFQLSISQSLYRYKYEVFEDMVLIGDYNCFFWRTLEQVAGIEPPANMDENGFDPAAIPMFIEDVDPAQPFITTVLAFQFHHGLCKAAGEFKLKNPQARLANCDIYKNAAAGNKLREMMKLGNSLPWYDALHVATGQSLLKGEGMLEYFRPLHNWLHLKNQENGAKLGWNPSSRSFCTLSQLIKMRSKAEENSGNLLVTTFLIIVCSLT